MELQGDGESGLGLSMLHPNIGCHGHLDDAGDSSSHPSEMSPSLLVAGTWGHWTHWAVPPPGSIS